MQYIQTSRNEYILQLSSGLKHLTNQSFNFHKILRLVREGYAETDIVELLIPPVLTDGCYYAYEYPEQNTMKYVHIDDEGRSTTTNLRPTDENFKGTALDAEKLVGVYVSLNDLMEEWPEYLL